MDDNKRAGFSVPRLAIVVIEIIEAILTVIVQQLAFHANRSLKFTVQCLDLRQKSLSGYNTLSSLARVEEQRFKLFDLLGVQTRWSFTRKETLASSTIPVS